MQAGEQISNHLHFWQVSLKSRDESTLYIENSSETSVKLDIILVIYLLGKGSFHVDILLQPGSVHFPKIFSDLHSSLHSYRST